MNDLLIRKINIDWNKISDESYLKNIRSISSIEELNFTQPITFFVGENGSGKSTLMEAIAISMGFNPEGGTRNYNFSTFDSHSELHEAIKITKGFRKINWGYFLRAESMYNVASKEVEYKSSLEGTMHTMSHGEGFLNILLSNMERNGIYIFDEPEAALSAQRQLTLLSEIQEYVKRGAQFIIVTHSPILLSMPNAEILNFDNGEIKPCSFEETESYKVTEMIINRREQVFKNLLTNI